MHYQISRRSPRADGPSAKLYEKRSDYYFK